MLFQDLLQGKKIEQSPSNNRESKKTIRQGQYIQKKTIHTTTISDTKYVATKRIIDIIGFSCILFSSCSYVVYILSTVY